MPNDLARQDKEGDEALDDCFENLHEWLGKKAMLTAAPLFEQLPYRTSTGGARCNHKLVHT